MIACRPSHSPSDPLPPSLPPTPQSYFPPHDFIHMVFREHAGAFTIVSNVALLSYLGVLNDM